MIDFADALRAMKDGKLVRRSRWLLGDSMSLSRLAQVWARSDDILADDWLVVEDEPKPAAPERVPDKYDSQINRYAAIPPQTPRPAAPVPRKPKIGDVVVCCYGQREFHAIVLSAGETGIKVATIGDGRSEQYFLKNGNGQWTWPE